MKPIGEMTQGELAAYVQSHLAKADDGCCVVWRRSRIGAFQREIYIKRHRFCSQIEFK